MPDPFTLRIFVPSGDPEGVRTTLAALRAAKSVKELR
jgi:hypothetical protein